ncbi:hypothetical protein NM688_g4951 [Phlebia brevispora]|uniref:Uncharacterized protein n=1 Tax=Phlebia brevispora TaxID=194682 RepID=A0ACC1T174_9APHY|nr:hypothetical protein NM688_g4951 [Phlebia brevispora]
MAATVSGSKRWNYFHSALQLAIQRSAHKWTYEDFTECFSLWCEEEPDASSSVYNTVSQHMESLITVRLFVLSLAEGTNYVFLCAFLKNGCEDLLKKLDVKPNIDRLHAVVTEARARKQAGYEGKDVWKEDLHPSAAARAQIIPLLMEEKDRLKAQLDELDKRNRALQAEMQANVRARDTADEESAKLLDLLDEASPYLTKNGLRTYESHRHARSGMTSQWRTSKRGRCRPPSPSPHDKRCLGDM